MPKILGRVRLGILALLASAFPVAAHVGSPDVYLEGRAGPYQLFVTVRPPSVIPGVAELEVRSESKGVRELRAVPLPISSVGAKFAPVPDTLSVSKEDPQFLTGSLWIMVPGSWQVRISADGEQGKGVLSVPLPSVALTTKRMQPGLGILLSVLGIFLVGGLAAMAGASVREAKLPAGTEIGPEASNRGKIATVVALVVIGAVLWFANAWWDSEASSYRKKVYKPLQMQAQLSDTGELLLNLNDPGWLTPLRRVDFRQVLFTRSVDDFVPDHNHLMHLYAIRQPGLDAVYHLHPQLVDRGRFRLRLPGMMPGDYKLYADVVHRNGFPETLVTSLKMPAGLPARGLEGDDAAGRGAPYTEVPATSTSFRLPDGY
jgi:hypothetical protein